ncbi:MAG: hypothetical protein ACJA06_000901 [Halocynthiibacter sp.]|jgi:hypothetical protein
MRKLLTLVILAAFAWGGYWFIGSSAVERSMKGWVAARQTEGWVAEYDRLDTVGFPNRFDTTIEGLSLADPRTGIAWDVPKLEILALSYKPHHIIAELPPAQSFATPLQKISIVRDRLRGSVVFEPDTKLAVVRSAFEMEGVELASTLGWKARIEQGRFATRQSEANPLAHDISFEATGLSPSESWRAKLDPAGVLPKKLEVLKLDATATFSDPWDRRAIEEARPQLTALKLGLMQAKWGDLELKLAGAIEVDDGGLPTGEIVIKATNWREMVEIARASGALPEAFVPLLTRAFEMLSTFSGNPKTLDAPLKFSNGRMSLGPIPLGNAPRLVIR